MKRPVVIFDFGNVVATFDYALACAPFASRLGLTATELIDRARARGLDSLTREHETGRMTGSQFVQDFCRIAGLEGVTESEFVAAWRSIFRLNQPVVRLIADLKARGYTLLLGSNTNALHADDFRVRFADALRPFDAFVLSYQVGHMKPAREFFDACVQSAGVPAADIVFIDDLPENVEGARAAGLSAIPYRDFPDLIARLQALGVSTANAASYV